MNSGVGDGHGGLAYHCSWCCKESDMTEQLNLTELKERMQLLGPSEMMLSLDESGGESEG